MDAPLGRNVGTTPVTADQRPSMAVIERCARLEGVDPLDLDPLYDAIDPDVLDSICTAPGFSSLEFTYCGRVVRLTSSGDDLQIAIDDLTTTDSENVANGESPI